MTSQPSLLPFEVEIELLDLLHGSLRSLASGNLGVAAVILVCAASSRNLSLEVMASLVCVAAAMRFLLTWFYNRARGDFSVGELEIWKNRTIWSASAVSVLLGLCSFIGVTQIGDAAITVPLVATAIGYAASSASRNAGVPLCVQSQLVLAIAPLGVGFLLNGGVANVAIAALMLSAVMAMIEISRSAYKTLVSALLFGREKHALADALAEQAANFDAALTNMPHGLAMFDASESLVICNRGFAEFFRLDDESRAKGASPSRIIFCAARAGLLPLDGLDLVEEQFVAGTRCRARQEMTLALRDGRIFELTFQAMAHGGAVVIVNDVTERKAQEAKIAHMARFDKLTGLPNRSQFEEKFAEILARTARSSQPFAVVCIDLDHFKEVNDTLTHMVGDQLLVAVARRMQGCIRPSDHLARFGGDEFVLILPYLDKDGAVAEVSGLLQRLIETVAEPYEIDSHAIVIGMSAGVAIAPADGRSRDDILRAADLALYKSKQQGRAPSTFSRAALTPRPRNAARSSWTCAPAWRRASSSSNTSRSSIL